MPISFDYGPPPSALGALSYQAGAGQEAIRRRSEIEAMQMQAAKMRQQQQQAALDRQFNSWKTQYSHHSALDKMQKEFKWKEGQAEKDHGRNKEMFGLGNERKDFEWDRNLKNARETWEINKVEEERRDQREQQQDRDRRREEAQQRQDEYEIKKVDDEQRIDDLRRYRKLNPDGQAAIDKIREKERDVDRDLRHKPAHLDPTQISEKQQQKNGFREQYEAVHDDDRYQLDNGRLPNSEVEHGIMIHERDADGRLNIYQNPLATKEQAMRHFEVTGDEMSNPESIYTGDTPTYKERGPYYNEHGKLVQKKVHRGTDENTGQSVWKAMEVPVDDPAVLRKERAEKDKVQRDAYYDAKEDIYGSLVDKDGDWTPYGKSLARKYFGDDVGEPDSVNLSRIVTPELTKRGYSLPDVGAAGGGAGLSPGDPGFGYTGGAFGAGSPLHETGAAGARRGDPMSLPPRRSERGVMSLPEQLAAGKGAVGATYATETVTKHAPELAQRGATALTPNVVGELAKRYRGSRNTVNTAKALEDLKRMPVGSPERKQMAVWLNSLKMVQQSQGGGKKTPAPVKKASPVNNAERSVRLMKTAAAYADLIDTSDAWRDGRNPMKRKAFMDGWEGWRKKLKALGMPDSHDILKISRKGVAQKDKESFEKWEKYVKYSLKKFAEGKGW